MRQSLRLGSISGIPVGINWGLLLIAGFYAFNLAVGILPRAVPDSTALAYWSFAVVNVVLFFGSVLAHEVGHSLVAQRNNIGVKEITLWIFGGVAVLEKEADNPGAEFRIAIAGPAVSVGLGVFFGALWFILSPAFGGGLLTFSLGYLAILNVVLAVFNMIPAAPLDGGRVLTSFLWSRNNNRHLSRAKAARVGEVFGTGMLIVGGLGILFGAGTFILAILGFFLRSAAGTELRRASVLDTLQHADVSASMSAVVAPISPGVSAAGIEALAQGDRRVAFPLRGAHGITGLIPSTAVDSIPPAQRSFVDADSLVITWDQFTSANLGERMTDVIERAQTEGKPHVLVYDQFGNQVGYVGLAQAVAPTG